MEQDSKLTPNALAFIAMTNEYCHLMEHASEYDKASLTLQLLKLLPRIYIVALDMDYDSTFVDNYIDPTLEEENYDLIRNRISEAMGEDDVYLDTFSHEMKYSDTPVAASISENLADLYQEFFNLINAVRDMTTEVQRELLAVCKDNFKNYWGITLCNVLRALHDTNFRNDDNDIY